MTSTQTDRANARGLPVPVALVLVSIAFSLAVGVWLGLAGLTTGVFALAVTAAQAAPALALLFVVNLVAGALLLLISAPIKRMRGDRRERLLIRGIATLNIWGGLVLAFLPLKGSEAFVRAGRLTTLELNVLGLAAILIGGCLAGWIVGGLASLVIGRARARLSPRSLGVLGVLCVLAALLTIVIGSSVRTSSISPIERSGEQGATHAPRVAIIGVDGCDWEKLGPLVEAGRLPNFERLMEEGCHGPLRSVPPLVSPRIWTSVATGKVAEKHGIFDFVNADGVPVNATMRTATPIWDIVSGYGEPVAVVGWYVTWPANDVNGLLLSDRVHSLLRGPVQIVQTLTGRPTNERLESFGDFTFDPAYKSYDQLELRYQQNRIVDEPLRWGYLRDAIYARLASALLPAYSPRLSAIYLRGVDFVQHFFWQYSDPVPFGGVSETDTEAYGNVIDNYYVYTDRLLGRLLATLGDDVNVLIVSDHGFQPRLDPDPGRPQLTGAHHIQGVFIAAGPEIGAIGRVEGATILDVTPTALAIMGLPVAEDMDGRVLSAIIRPECLDASPVTTTESYEDSRGVRESEIGSTMDESIREQLKSLGYIE